ncbi:hypothetical protein COO60DRAFT_1489546 [Scenedesmus sp. NREL 46B-D3]|nr:hypothetical protein COO60DRAFT_1489546 [Scenedesmus sp. NREL 46B-D3]
MLRHPNCLKLTSYALSARLQNTRCLRLCAHLLVLRHAWCQWVQQWGGGALVAGTQPHLVDGVGALERLVQRGMGTAS